MPCDSTAFIEKNKKINKINPGRSCWEQRAEPRAPEPRQEQGWVTLGTLQSRAHKSFSKAAQGTAGLAQQLSFVSGFLLRTLLKHKGRTQGGLAISKAREASDISPAFRAGLFGLFSLYFPF